MSTPGQTKLAQERGSVPVGANTARIELPEPTREDKVAAPAAIDPILIPASQPATILPASKPEEPAKPTAGKNDPFADLDTLEAEMARLLGRDKL